MCYLPDQFDPGTNLCPIGDTGDAEDELVEDELVEVAPPGEPDDTPWCGCPPWCGCGGLR